MLTVRGLIRQFTYNMLQGAPGDEQDIEILGHTIFDKMPNGTPPGIQLTNWDVRSFPLSLRFASDSFVLLHLSSSQTWTWPMIYPLCSAKR